MKKLSETYKELGIAVGYPIPIRDSAGNDTYHENSNGTWMRWEYDSAGNQTYYENSDGSWIRWEYDSAGNQTYYENINGTWIRWEYNSAGNETYCEDSNGLKRGTPRAASLLGEVSSPAPTVDFLRRHNRWRRGDMSIAMESPKAIGEAIDAACDNMNAMYAQLQKLKNAQNGPTCGQTSPRSPL